MIASIRGEVLSFGAGWVVVSVGGMGFRAETPGRTPGIHLGEQIELHTQLVVREDSLTLFGFSTKDELEVFGLLLGVTGVGPRSALGVLTELTPVEVARAVSSEDDKPFRRVSGIGPKTAKLIAVQLAGKLEPLSFASQDDAHSVDTRESQESGNSSIVVQGLVGLGYGENDAVYAVREAQQAGAPEDQAGLLRAALLLLQTPRLGGRSSAANGGSQ